MLNAYLFRKALGLRVTFQRVHEVCVLKVKYLLNHSVIPFKAIEVILITTQVIYSGLLIIALIIV